VAGETGKCPPRKGGGERTEVEAREEGGKISLKGGGGLLDLTCRAWSLGKKFCPEKKPTPEQQHNERVSGERGKANLYTPFRKKETAKRGGALSQTGRSDRKEGVEERERSVRGEETLATTSNRQRL